jgi:hypothetical protein
MLLHVLSGTGTLFGTYQEQKRAYLMCKTLNPLLRIYYRILWIQLCFKGEKAQIYPCRIKGTEFVFFVLQKIFVQRNMNNCCANICACRLSVDKTGENTYQPTTWHGIPGLNWLFNIDVNSVACPRGEHHISKTSQGPEPVSRTDV